MQIWRYRHLSSTVDRQQTKWVAYGVAVALAGNTSVVALASVAGPDGLTPGSAAWLASFMVARSLLLVIPVSVAVAVLRFRLWDVVRWSMWR